MNGMGRSPAGSGTRQRVRVLGVLMLLLLCGVACVACAGPAATRAAGAEAVPLPDGWQVYLPELEFSTVAVAGEHLLAGGLHGLYGYGAAADRWTALEAVDGAFHLVKAIARDHAGNVWIGHDKGLSCLPAAAVGTAPDMTQCRLLAEVAGKRVSSVNTLCVASDGTVYAGTFQGAVSLSPEAVDGWLATGDTCAMAWMGPAEGLINDMVNVIFEDSRGYLWFGAYIARGGGVACLREGTVQHFNHENGLVDDYVTTIAEDADGAIWVGSGVYTSGGAARFVHDADGYRPGGQRRLADGLAGDKVRHLFADDQNRLWFCSEYDGIAIFDGTGARTALLTEADGLPDNEVKQVARAPDASLWLACRRGLLRISREAALRVGA